MCGIIAHFGEIEKTQLVAMTQILTHRGPDNTGYYNDDNKRINLVHTRLKVVDLENEANQPFISSCKNFIIVYNGEIYNSPQLRKNLIINNSNIKFKTQKSDTETVLLSYMEMGIDFVSKLEGMFAFVILDLKNELIISARDHFGQKPLYYTRLSGNLLFTSELTAIEYLHKCRLKKSNIALAKFFAYDSIPAPLTLYEQVYKVEPATIQIHSLKTYELIKKEKYWSPKYKRNLAEIKIDELDYLLKKTVNQCAFSDVPISLMLSGGVDSTLVGSYLSQKMNHIASFNMGFKRKSFDESERGLLASMKLDTVHQNFQFDKLFNEEILNHLYSRLDEPNGDSGLVAYYLLSKEVAKKYKVAIGGDGGDEAFFGYDTHQAFALTRLLPRLFIKKPAEFLSFILPCSDERLPLKLKLKRFSSGLNFGDNMLASKWMSSVSTELINRLIGSNFTDREIYSDSIKCWEETSSNIYDKFNSYYLNIYLPSKVLAKVDRASMLNSLEIRSPLLNRELYEYTLNYSVKNFHNGIHNKVCLRNILKNKTNKKLARFSKQGFGVPISDIIKGEFIQDKIKKIDFLNSDLTNRILNEHLTSSQQNDQLLWNLFTLSYKR